MLSKCMIKAVFIRRHHFQREVSLRFDTCDSFAAAAAIFIILAIMFSRNAGVRKYFYIQAYRRFEPTPICDYFNFNLFGFPKKRRYACITIIQQIHTLMAFLKTPLSRLKYNKTHRRFGKRRCDLLYFNLLRGVFRNARK